MNSLTSNYANKTQKNRIFPFFSVGRVPSGDDPRQRALRRLQPVPGMCSWYRVPGSSCQVLVPGSEYLDLVAGSRCQSPTEMILIQPVHLRAHSDGQGVFENGKMC